MKSTLISWKKLPLKEVLDYEQPNEYIIETSIKEEGSIPVLTANKAFIKGYTDESKGIYKSVPVIIFDDFTADYKFVDFPFKVKSSAMKFLKSKNKDVCLKFVYYQMSLTKVNTTTHKRHYISTYQDLEFLFPVNKDNTLNLQEQEEIVQEIEKQFTRLDESVKSLKDAKRKLEVYRKSVLKSAIILKKTKTIETGPIERFCLDINQIVPQKEDFDRFTYIDIGSIDNKKQVITSPQEIFSKDAPSRARQETLPGDIVYSTVRIYLKNMAVVPELKGKLVSSTGFCVLRTNNQLNNKLLFYYLMTDKVTNHLNSKQVGTSYPAIRKKELMDYEIQFPKSKTEQQKIVQEIESRFSVIDKTEQLIDSSLAKAELLRKSILKSAFEGKLVEVDAT